MPTATSHEISIVYGSTTISLSWILSFTPKNEASGTEFVTEDLQLISAAQASIAAMETLQRDLDKAFVQAKRYAETRVGDKVYLHWQKEGSADIYRSPIRAGKASLTDNALGNLWRNRMLRQMVVLTRENYWETVTEYELQLSNSNTAATTGGVVVYCHDDADTGHDNYVQIAAAQVGGSLPTPPRLEITHTYASAICGDIFVNLNSFAAPTTFTHILEGESSTGYETTSTPSDATCSAGAYRTTTWATSTSTRLMMWSLSSAMLTAMAGNRARIGVTLAALPAAAYYLHWRVLFNGLTPITSTENREDQLSTYNRMQMLSDIYLPPRNLGMGTYNGLSLALYGRYPGGGTLAVDYLHLSVMDGSRFYKYIAYGLGTNYRLVDDPIDDAVWVDTGASTDRYPLYNKPEGTLELAPNTTQRLYFMARSASGAAPILRTFSVRAYVRYRVAVI